jgi:hypothetical protein
MLLANLIAGALLIAGTVMIHTFGLILLTHWMSWIVHRHRLHRHSFTQSVAMVTTVLGLFVVHTVEVWTWAAVYILLGVVPRLETALYFSTVTFSTLGSGDIAPARRMAVVLLARGDQRLHFDRLVHGLSGRGVHTPWSFPRGRALLSPSEFTSQLGSSRLTNPRSVPRD